MPLSETATQFLASVHPYDSLPDAAVAELATICEARTYNAGAHLFSIGGHVTHLFVIRTGDIEVTDENGALLSRLGVRNSIGERALLRGGVATRTATAVSEADVILIPSAALFDLIETSPAVARFFDRSGPRRQDRRDLATLPVGDLMTRDPAACAPDTTIRDAAGIMRDAGISSVCVTRDGGLRGIVTVRDMTTRGVAAGVDPTQPVSTIMTPRPLTLPPSALGSDVLHMMMERRISHVPIAQGDTLLGIVTKTDLARVQAMSSADLVRRVSRADTAAGMTGATAEIPQLLAQLVANGVRHEAITRLITDIADTATRRLLALAEKALGPAPVAYVWAACGSQGRQEQTGVSDQDNALIVSDDATDADMAYFADLARFVSDGLDACGYYYCPGEMMATNPMWCQPLRVWRDYFDGWIARPNPKAQMLASVMFDMRAIGGEKGLLDQLYGDTLAKASRNSIFVAHMISNSLKHQPPLGLLRGLATIRSGEHRNRLDLKLNGVVPVVDLGRIYTLQAQLGAVNTRARLEAAQKAGVLSASGGADLLEAYDLIATMRLEHQAAQVRAGGKPDNFLDPSTLSDFERSHLRDAFVVIKTMQSAAGSGKGALG